MIYSNLVNFDYQLCDMCLKRNFPTFKHYFTINNINCFICKGIFSKINEMVQKMFEMIHFEENYSYRSFTIGTTLPYYMFDIEDSIRSHYKLKGIEDIKSSFNFKIRKNFKSLSKKKLNIINPDIKINLSISDNNDYSIKVVSDCIRSDKMVFSWYGSEDDNSQVLGKGRLFLVQLINPRKRTIKMNKVFTRNGISFKIIEKKDYLENVKRNFRIKNKIFIKTSNPINKIYFINLMKLNNSIIRYRYKSKIFSKKIYRIGFKKLDPYHLIIHVECDSGL